MRLPVRRSIRRRLEDQWAACVIVGLLATVTLFGLGSVTFALTL